MENKRLVITGGHLTAALAVIDKLSESTNILFIGRKHSFENDKSLSLEYLTLKKRHIDFVGLTTGRLQRIFTKDTVPSLVKLPVGYFQALQVLSRFRPPLVLCFGGYLSIPVAFAASTLGIPVVIHEQTLGAGLANKLISKFAKKICISWASSSKFFPPKKVVLTGNPIRESVISSYSKPYKTFPNSLPVIYITGGSSGAHKINVLVEEVLEKLLDKANIIHQTGNALEFQDFNRLSALRESLPEALKNRYVVTEFIDPEEVGSVYKSADVVIGRSGISTITELIYFQKPALLIPLPGGQKNEQMQNALFLEKLGLAIICNQHTLTSASLLERLTEIIHNTQRYALKEQHILIPDATDRIIQVIHSL